MSNEIEAKFAVGTFTSIRRRLRQLKATPLGSNVESDRFLDTPGGDLYHKGCGLRIRSFTAAKTKRSPGKGKALLTYKGPRNKSSRLKIRLEIETGIDDAQALTAIFGELGMVVRHHVAKHRTSYRLGRCRVELDELDGVGRFVEVEGPSEKAVYALCRKLHLDGEPIPDSYLALSLAAGDKTRRTR